MSRRRIAPPSVPVVARGSDDGASTIKGLQAIVDDLRRESSTMQHHAARALTILDRCVERESWDDRCSAIRRILPPCPTTVDDAASFALATVHHHLDVIEIALASTDDLRVAARTAGQLERRGATVAAEVDKAHGHRGGRPPKVLTQVVAAALQGWSATWTATSLRARFDRRTPNPWPLPPGVVDVEPTDAGLVIRRRSRHRDLVSWDDVEAAARKIRAAPKPRVT